FRSDMLRPFPSRLIGSAADGHSAQMDQLEPAFLKRTHLIRLVEALKDDRDVHQSNRLETLVSSAIRRIASASSGAIVRRRIRPSWGSASPLQIESVTTSSLNSDFATRA